MYGGKDLEVNQKAKATRAYGLRWSKYKRQIEWEWEKEKKKRREHKQANTLNSVTNSLASSKISS